MPSKIVDAIHEAGPLSKTAIEPIFQHLMTIIQRTWTLSRRILATGDTSEEPDHESVRIDAILDDDGDEPMLSPGETSEGRLVLLSNTWRSIKEAG